MSSYRASYKAPTQQKNPCNISSLISRLTQLKQRENTRQIAVMLCSLK